jgi:hypothetical protein
MDDVLEVLNDLEFLVSDWNTEQSETILQFIANQRSIYQPARGECAA